MKVLKRVLLGALVATLAFSGTAFASTDVGSGVNGSVHDMNTYVASGTAYEDNGTLPGRTCAYCHTPHHAKPAVNPLWNHAVTNATFIEYANPTLDGVWDADTGPSRMCLSCHDGTVAVDSHYSMTGSTAITGGANLTTDLSDDHPIGVSYQGVINAENAANSTDGLSGAGLFDISTRRFLIGSTQTTPAVAGEAADGLTDAEILAGGTGVLVSSVLFGGDVVTCASCHDVHNKQNVDDYLLYGAQKDSGICLSCHDK